MQYTIDMSIFGGRRIYLDYASSTPLCTSAARAIRRAERIAGNPSSIHAEGVEAKRSLENSRARIAAQMGVKAREIVFTSGITESNNLGILGTARRFHIERGSLTGTHWIVSSIEHASVLECFAEIERLGGAVSFADPDARGIITPDSVRRILRPETVFVSIGWANNEIGTIQPLSFIRDAIRTYEAEHATTVVFHTDAGQAPLYLAPHPHTLGVDLLSLGASKLYGPHGVGALFVGSRAGLAPIMLGGGQERGLRSGTENVALAAGFAEALVEAGRERDKQSQRLAALRGILAEGLVRVIPGAVVNGLPAPRGTARQAGDLKHVLPNMLNVSIPGVQSEYLMLALDRAGIAVSTKSACDSGEARSHVVLELARARAAGDEWCAESALRFSLGRATTKREVQRTIAECAAIVRRLKSAEKPLQS